MSCFRDAEEPIADWFRRWLEIDDDEDEEEEDSEYEVGAVADS